MTNQIAIIDPFVKGPAVHCYNRLVNLLGIQATYFQPSQFGIEDLQKHADGNQGYIVLGSASNVTEPLEWHRPLADFLLSELEKNKPILGCCFGHQLICHALESQVDYHSTDHSEHMGVRSVTVDRDFMGFKKGEVFQLAVTHRQVVKNLAPGLISVGTGLANDFVIHEKLPFMGTQPHPEVSDYFCVTDIDNLTPDEIQLVKQDGGRLILRFFKHFQLI
jgi:GMP synthase-like glutamine amidotransferase